MDTFGTGELQCLIREHATPCVSVYLPTHPTGEDGQQDPLRLKNLLQRAEVRLAETGTPATSARKLLKTARDSLADATFWEKRSQGLAVFVAPDMFHCYRLPLQFVELAFVKSRFHVRPLLPMLESGGRFLILALSQNNVRLFGALRYTIEEIELGELPNSMKDALNYVEADRGSQVHSAMRGSLGKQAAVFHGHGGQPDARKGDLLQFFRLIDNSLKPFLHDEGAPMLLAGVEYLLPLYREINHYPHVVDRDLLGNCDYLTSHEVHEKAWPLMKPFFRQARELASVRYRELIGTGKACDDIEQIMPAARDGRIETLFVCSESDVWGAFDAQTGAVELHDGCQAGGDDLLDAAAVSTLSQRGTVYSLNPDDMPSREPIAAVLRY